MAYRCTGEGDSAAEGQQSTLFTGAHGREIKVAAV